MSVLNAPLVLFSAPSYETWIGALDRICRQRLSISIHDLPDLPTRAAYDAGTGPTLFFEEAILPNLREQHGAIVDELLVLADNGQDPFGASATEDR